MALRDVWNRLFRSPAPAGAANPVTEWLDAAGLPWRATRAELAARYGIRADNPYRWDLVSLDVRPPPLGGMLWPFGFQASPRHSPSVPPATLSTHVHLGDNTETNIAAALAGFAPILGGRAIVDQYNTRKVEWRFGTASVSLLVWPPAMQTGPRLANPARERDPRLATACSVSVRSGWRPPLSAREQAWLDGFVPMGATRNWTAARPRAALGDTMFAETQLEFMREPPPDVARLRGVFGLSADGAALICCEDALYVVPLTEIAGFEVMRVLPAKGGGGSYLSAVCETGEAACPTKKVQVAQGERADDLNDVARRLARETGKPLELGEYFADA